MYVGWYNGFDNLKVDTNMPWGNINTYHNEKADNDAMVLCPGFLVYLYLIGCFFTKSSRFKGNNSGFGCSLETQ